MIHINRFFISFILKHFKLNSAAIKMIRIFGNISKIGFSRISSTIPAAGQIFSSRKFCEKSPDETINSIIEEIKKDINKLESEIEPIIVNKKDEELGINTLQPPFKSVQPITTEKTYKKPEEITIHFAKIKEGINKLESELDNYLMIEYGDPDFNYVLWEPPPKTLHLETMDYSVDDEPKKRSIRIKLEQEHNGKKLIRINLKMGDDLWDGCVLPAICMPADANLLFNAMNALEDDWKENNAKTIRQNKPTMICQQLFKGILEWKLEIHFHPNKPLDFRMMAMALPKCKNGEIHLTELRGPIPIEVFYWLKAQMAEILANCDDNKGRR